MISEIGHTSMQKERTQILLYSILVNVLLLAPILAMAYLATGTVYSACYVTLFIFAVINIPVLAILTEERKDFDTLNFRVSLSREGSAQRKARFLEMVGAAEKHLDRIRVTMRISGAARNRSWPMSSLDRTYELPGIGMTFKAFVVRDIGGSPAAAVFALGPVPDGTDSVARELLEGLRQELLRLEGKGPPEGKA